MYYHQPLLLTPGPTPVPDAIMREIQAPDGWSSLNIFEDIAQQAFQGLKPIFGVKMMYLLGHLAVQASWRLVC